MPRSLRNKILVTFYFGSLLTLLGFIAVYVLAQRQQELARRNLELQPVAESWFILSNRLHQAVQVQREWLVSREERSREFRAEAWSGIHEQMERLTTFYKGGESGHERVWRPERNVEARHYYDVRLLLLELEAKQKQVEVTVSGESKPVTLSPDLPPGAVPENLLWLQANTLMVQEVLPLSREVEAAIEAIVRIQFDLAQEASQQAHQELVVLNIRILFIGLAVFIFVWMLARLLSHQITLPLKRLRDQVRTIREQDDRQPIVVESRDEVGDLAREFQQLMVEIRERTSQLESANRELESATQAKSDFLTHMSHELRTPLNAINGFAETLLNAGPDDPLTDYQQDRLTRILQSGRKLLELINTLLDLAKIEAGKMEVTLQRFELSVVLQEVFELMEPLAEPKALQLKLELEATDWQCQTDEGKLRQVFINLLGNAVKFTPKDGVVRVRASCEEGWVTVAVEDNGPGIDKQQLEHIFEVFEQAASHSSTSGTGLGLAIVQSLMQLLAGTISVSSEPGSGSTFLVRFPAAHPTLSLE